MADRRAIVIPESLTDALIGESSTRLAVTNFGAVSTLGFVNASVATAGEIFITVGAAVQFVEISLESNFAFRLAASSGATSTLYKTYPHGSYVSPQLNDSSSKTFYIRTIRDAEVVQVLTWS